MSKVLRSKVFTFVLVAVIAVSMLLTGCGGGNSSGGGEKKEEAKSTIKYPEKPIDLIVPWDAGGSTDTATRLYAKYAEKELGTTINVLNVTGGNGAVGMLQGAQAKPDGYTLTLLNFDILTAEAQKLAPLSHNDFELVNMFTVQPTVIIVRKDSGWNSLEDFIKAAKEKPGEYKVGGAGEGGVWHQAVALAEEKMGIEMNYIPYKGSSEQLAALLGKHIDIMFTSPTASLPHLAEGTLIMLATMTEERLPYLPEVPTLKELGYDASYSSWRGIGAPKGTPDEVMQILREAFKKAYDNPEYQAKCEEAKIDSYYLDHEKFREFLNEQYPIVESVMKKLGFAK
ncbi:MAG: tripartite tricarboxylate transporter substrate binding protein [Tepidanaerobacter acetatoxydans]|uniref:tripartite tricarboxylate transporter substrate binding protein n=1 Tax=Tepidanaerobacter acetatoxydans TaxID=499229 RepID=UPI0026EE3AE7|nr:tripartite tricarboxylate transporter substrate binding protein [Tepidanaerobacter acetatoxydans]NLU10179.1 tripartite tricarboxylate transporter substrate binding protein [Tepidanaerobacter acetatoxydans]